MRIVNTRNKKAMARKMMNENMVCTTSDVEYKGKEYGHENSDIFFPKI
jgi:hypothetical protein